MAVLTSGSRNELIWGVAELVPYNRNLRSGKGVRESEGGSSFSRRLALISQLRRLWPN